MVTGKYGADVAKYIPGVLKIVYQGMLEDIDTKEKAVHSSYKGHGTTQPSNNANRQLLHQP